MSGNRWRTLGEALRQEYAAARKARVTGWQDRCSAARRIRGDWLRSAAARTGDTEMTSCSGMASHGGAGQWHGAAHVPVHITQRDVKEFDCPGARDGTLGKRPQAQAFKSSGPFAGHGVRFLVRRRASAFALPLRTMRPVSRVRGTASMGMVPAKGIDRFARGGDPAPKSPERPPGAGLSSARTGRSRPCEGDDRRRIATAAKTSPNSASRPSAALRR